MTSRRRSPHGITVFTPPGRDRLGGDTDFDQQFNELVASLSGVSPQELRRRQFHQRVRDAVATYHASTEESTT